MQLFVSIRAFLFYNYNNTFQLNVCAFPRGSLHFFLTCEALPLHIFVFFWPVWNSHFPKKHFFWLCGTHISQKNIFLASEALTLKTFVSNWPLRDCTRSKKCFFDLWETAQAQKNVFLASEGLTLKTFVSNWPLRD